MGASESDRLCFVMSVTKLHKGCFVVQPGICDETEGTFQVGESVIVNDHGDFLIATIEAIGEEDERWGNRAVTLNVLKGEIKPGSTITKFQ